MCRQRRRYRERLEFFRSNVEAVVRIQTFWRAKKTKKDYKQLGKGTNTCNCEILVGIVFENFSKKLQLVNFIAGNLKPKLIEHAQIEKKW